MVVTRHISHDGLLIGPQGANDVCAGNRKEGGKKQGQGGEKGTRVKECRDQTGVAGGAVTRGGNGRTQASPATVQFHSKASLLFHKGQINTDAASGCEATSDSLTSQFERILNQPDQTDGPPPPS